MGSTSVNGTTIHHHVRGEGPALLFVSGAGGDAGYWTEVADLLADTFTVITYDRRGNSRSPSSPGHTTSLEEQAEDAAALLQALDLAPAIVVGNSLGAIITCALVEKHPEIVQRAVLHEPPLLAAVADGEQVGAQLATMIGDGMSRGGPRAAMELFLRSVCTDTVVDRMDRQLVERVLGNAEVFLGQELALVAGYRPEPGRLATSGVPLTVAAGRDNRGMYLHTGTAWLADELGLPFHELAGAHVPYLSGPSAFADELCALITDEPTTAGRTVTPLP